MIISIHNQNPGTPLDEQRPGIERYQVGQYCVDATGGCPTLAEIEAVRNPPKTKPQRIAALLAPYKLERISIQMIIGMAELSADLVELKTLGVTTRAADLLNSFNKNVAYRIARTLENACLAIAAEA